MTFGNVLLLTASLMGSGNLAHATQDPSTNFNIPTALVQVLDAPTATTPSSQSDTSVRQVAATREAADSAWSNQGRLAARAEENKRDIAFWNFVLGIITALATLAGTVLVPVINRSRSTGSEQGSGRSERWRNTAFVIAFLAQAFFVFIILPSQVAPAGGTIDHEIVRQWIVEELADESRMQGWADRLVDRRLEEVDSSIQSMRSNARHMQTQLTRYRSELDEYSQDVTSITDAVKQSRERFPTEHYLLTGYGDLQREVAQMQTALSLVNATVSGSVDEQESMASQFRASAWLATLFIIVILSPAMWFFYMRTRRLEQDLESLVKTKAGTVGVQD